jgi:hypothetical protein
VNDGGAAASNEHIAVAGSTQTATSVNHDASLTCSFVWSYDENQANNGSTATLREVALFNRSESNSNSGTMVSRATFGDIVKNSDVQVSFTYELRFSAT